MNNNNNKEKGITAIISADNNSEENGDESPLLKKEELTSFASPTDKNNQDKDFKIDYNDGENSVKKNNNNEDLDISHFKLETVKHQNIFVLLGLNSFSFAYGMVVSSMGLIVLPIEALRMFANQHSIVLGIFMAIAGLTQLIGPICGLLSDRTTFKFGRRRIWMILSGIPTIIFFGLMWVARYFLLGWLYMIVYFFAITLISVMYSAFAGLIPDFVPNEQLGAASGCMAVLNMAGSSLGFILFGFLLDASWSYLCYMILLFLSIVITTIVAREKALNLNGKKLPKLTFKEIASSYWIDPRKHRDFFIVFITRTLYYMGVSVQVFIMYYLRDCIQTSNPEKWTSVLALIAQFSAGLIAYPIGKMSDYVGRKILVYIACVMMALTYAGFLIWKDLLIFLMLGVFYGVGNGIYVSVDYALGVDVLPSKDSSAKDLAIWGIAALLGTFIGPMVGGVVLYFVGRIPNDPDHYAFRGYLVVNVLSGIYVLLGAVVVYFVKKCK